VQTKKVAVVMRGSAVTICFAISPVDELVAGGAQRDKGCCSISLVIVPTSSGLNKKRLEAKRGVVGPVAHIVYSSTFRSYAADDCLLKA
jgi:hypothetical protein